MVIAARSAALVCIKLRDYRLQCGGTGHLWGRFGLLGTKYLWLIICLTLSAGSYQVSARAVGNTAANTSNER
jgi:hypothetical protein